MNLRNVDLNLLTIFDKLIEHQNVSSAANDLGMTQSAVSHALSRLRSHFGDELFIRTPKGMVPTALALRLKPELQSVLNDIRFLMDSKPAFDPATSKHKFTIGISEYAAQALFPSLQGALLQKAPGVQIISSNISRYDGKQILKDGKIDFLIGNIPMPDKSNNFVSLYDDHFVIIADKSNPITKNKTISIEDYLKARHIKISLRGVKRNFLDEHLKKVGHERTSSFVLANYTLGFPLVSNSPYLLSEPYLMSVPWLDIFNLEVRDFPIPIPPVNIKMVWHRRFDEDPAHKWMREKLIAIAKTELNPRH